MIHMIFTIYDDKAECYLPPFYMKTVGEALRAFTDSANDVNHAFCKYPADYTMFKLGHFDDGNASFELHPTPASIGKAIEYKTQREMPVGDLLIDKKGSV